MALPSIHNDFNNDIPHTEQLYTDGRHAAFTGGDGLSRRRATFTGGRRAGLRGIPCGDALAPASAPGAPIALGEPRWPHHEWGLREQDGSPLRLPLPLPVGPRRCPVL